MTGTKRKISNNTFFAFDNSISEKLQVAEDRIFSTQPNSKDETEAWQQWQKLASDTCPHNLRITDKASMTVPSAAQTTLLDEICTAAARISIRAGEVNLVTKKTVRPDLSLKAAVEFGRLSGAFAENVFQRDVVDQLLGPYINPSPESVTDPALKNLIWASAAVKSFIDPLATLSDLRVQLSLPTTLSSLDGP